MTADADDKLRRHLLREDGQEDICVATYRPSTGATRRTALLREVLLPRAGEREVHGNASLTGEYVIRAAVEAHEQGAGLIICHSHPRGRGWQGLSGPDRDAEKSFANLAREITGKPLVGMTLAGGDGAWSARHWNVGAGGDVAPTDADNVRVIGDRLVVTWNDSILPPPMASASQRRSISCWGQRIHDDLVRRSVLIVGLGSVGLDIAVRLAATGLTRIGLMDFDTVELGNLDRLSGATPIDVWLRRSKVHLARRLVRQNATAASLDLRVWEASICEEDGLAHALDYDIIICCVDRPWARAVLNALAYTDLIPVIDGGVAVDVYPDGDGMRNATWRSHVIRLGRPCMSCNGQLDVGQVTVDIEGLLDDPEYVKGQQGSRRLANQGQNVTLLAINAAASMLAQYVSLNVAPGGIGDPGPLQYVLSTNTLDHLSATAEPNCLYESAEGLGDNRMPLTGSHRRAELHRLTRSRDLSRAVRVGRVIDDFAWACHRQASRFAKSALMGHASDGHGRLPEAHAAEY